MDKTVLKYQLIEATEKRLRRNKRKRLGLIILVYSALYCWHLLAKTEGITFVKIIAAAGDSLIKVGFFSIVNYIVFWTMFTKGAEEDSELEKLKKNLGVLEEDL